MIEISGVTYRYPGGEQPALRNLSLIVPDGQFLAVVGANSAGKTSLANLVAGFIPHFYHGTLEGTVSLDGKPTGEQSLAEIMQSVGYVFQNPYNQISGARFSVREEIAFGLENLGVPVEVMEQHVAEAMQVTGISALAERSPLALSGGQMQRVAIASILAMQPRILILDEPTAQLDPAGSREVFAAVRGLMQNRPMTVIMIEHKVEWLAEYADRLIVLVEGALVADGAPREVLADERLMQFGVGLTRYTRAAFLARAAGWWPPGRRAAVTLDEAVDGMRAAGVGVGGA